jgi:hypothetical protein
VSAAEQAVDSFKTQFRAVGDAEVDVDDDVDLIP